MSCRRRRHRTVFSQPVFWLLVIGVLMAVNAGWAVAGWVR